MDTKNITSVKETDIGIELMNPEASPFFLKGMIDDECVLIIHGYTGSPASIRPLADYLNNNGEGYNVCGILLPEHGTNMDDLFKSRWKKWFLAGVHEFNRLKKQYSKVSVIGFSMGGNIALCMAASLDVYRVVTISTPILIRNKLSYFTEFLSIFRKYQYWRKSVPLEGELSFDYSLGYAGMPVRSIAEVRKITIASLNRLHRIEQPILIAQSIKDSTVHTKSPYLIYDLVNSVYKELLFLENARHNAIISPEREHLFKAVYEFLGREIILDRKIL